MDRPVSSPSPSPFPRHGSFGSFVSFRSDRKGRRVPIEREGRVRSKGNERNEGETGDHEGGGGPRDGRHPPLVLDFVLGCVIEAPTGDDRVRGKQEEGGSDERMAQTHAGEVHYDAKLRLFRLFAKNSLYAFRVDESGLLEHLHWGATASDADDLRFLSYNNVALQFDPGPMGHFTSMQAIHDLIAPTQLHDDEVLRREWDAARAKGRAVHAAEKHVQDEEEDIIEARRRENAAWRLMKMRELRAKKASDNEFSELLGQLSDVESEDLDYFPISHDAQEPRDHGLGVSPAQLSLDFSKLKSFSANELFELPKSITPSMTPRESPRITLSEWRDAAPVGRNTKLFEYADSGTGDYRPASFEVLYIDGSSLSPLTYMNHRIVPGKLPMKEAAGRLPELDAEEGSATSLVVSTIDTLTGLQVDLIYTVYADVDAMTRRAIIRNRTGKVVHVRRLMSATVDFHSAETYYVSHLSGSWANERHIVTSKVNMGRFSIESCRGTSSHQHNPFVALTVGQPEEESGEVFAMSLVYSGNFKVETDMSENGRVRVNVGINPSKFEWDLPHGDAFETPECVLVYSANGLTTMSHQFHDLFRKHLFPQNFRTSICPVLVNTWEAMYFDVTHENVIDLAKAAAHCGVEMLVLDDGWFGTRNDATSSLGDWYVNKDKLPHGLGQLAEEINGLGLKFGLWVEPEMINENSELYASHPDWVLHQLGRPRSQGRNQLVLDLTRYEVREYLIEAITSVLQSANIEYVKWDMNRHLTEVYANALPPSKQGEVHHRYCVGVYVVLHELVKRFPRVLFETCSGGGGRFDAGMLYYSPQIWTSDNTDASSRLLIQHGTSLVYPPCCMASHISAVPNHQTMRLSTLKHRFLVSLFGSLGLELDLRTLSPNEMSDLQSYLHLYKELAPIVHNGDFYRLWNPFRSHSLCAWMSFHKELKTGLMAVFLTSFDPGRYLPRLRAKGLDSGCQYQVEEIVPSTVATNVQTGKLEMCPNPVYQLGQRSIVVSGATLMNIGLPIHLRFDGDSAAFVIRAL